MDEHTKGPWSWHGTPENIHVVQSNRPHIRVCFLTSDGPTKANAKLIAACPLMLEALRAIADDEAVPQFVRTVARAAISTASGEEKADG